MDKSLIIIIFAIDNTTTSFPYQLYKLRMTRIILLLLLTCWVFESPAQSRNTTVYEYDNLNRLVHVSYQDREVHYSYDELGNSIGMLVVGSSLKGDVNEDGMVTYNDVAALICIILNQDIFKVIIQNRQV